MRWKALFAGDITMVADPGKDWISPRLRSYIVSHDLASCNFEGPVGGGGAPVRKAGPHVAQCAASADRTVEAGFGIANLANNHVMDFGADGLSATREAFGKRAVSIGAGLSAEEAYAAAFLDVKGVRVGMLSFCESEFGAARDGSGAGFAWVNHPRVDALVQRTRRECDTLILQVHAGIEEEDVPLPEWRDRYKRLIELGGDCVIGHHPHQPQGWEMIDGKPVIYSLGNFYFQPPCKAPWAKAGAVASLEFEGSIPAGLEMRIVDWSGGPLDLDERPEGAARLEGLRKALEEPGYSRSVESMAARLWEERYSRYYLDAVNGTDPRTGIPRSFKLFLKRLLVPARLAPDEPLLLHNLAIESHRWVVERELRRRLGS